MTTRIKLADRSTMMRIVGRKMLQTLPSQLDQPFAGSKILVRSIMSSPTKPTLMMAETTKPGTKLPSGLSIYKNVDPPVVLKQEEYPEWMKDLSKPLPSLAQLRRMPNDDATIKDVQRYLKLQRRNHIRQQNEQASV